MHPYRPRNSQSRIYTLFDNDDSLLFTYVMLSITSGTEDDLKEFVALFCTPTDERFRCTGATVLDTGKEGAWHWGRTIIRGRHPHLRMVEGEVKLEGDPEL